jgi:hypothetical protein
MPPVAAAIPAAAAVGSGAGAAFLPAIAAEAAAIAAPAMAAAAAPTVAGLGTAVGLGASGIPMMGAPGAGGMEGVMAALQANPALVTGMEAAAGAPNLATLAGPVGQLGASASQPLSMMDAITNGLGIGDMGLDIETANQLLGAGKAYKGLVSGGPKPPAARMGQTTPYAVPKSLSDREKELMMIQQAILAPLYGRR